MKRCAVKQYIIVSVMLFCILLTSCVIQTPVLTDIPLPTPTTEVVPEINQSITYESGIKDLAGADIYDQQTHYDRYLSFRNLRVYEYGGDTLLDGICENTYPEPLYGAYRLMFIDKDGTLVGEGILLFDEDEHLIPPGETRLFSTINTDMSVIELPFSLVADEAVRPYDDGVE